MLPNPRSHVSNGNKHAGLPPPPTHLDAVLLECAPLLAQLLGNGLNLLSALCVGPPV